MGEFQTFSTYLLWYLIDLGLVIDEYKEMDVFHAMVDYNFNEFITTFMKERIKAIEDKKPGLEKTYKMILNSSYGKDGMNTAKYSNVKVLNRNMTLFKQTNPLFVNTRQIDSDLYAVQLSKSSYSIKTPLQCACACLDNAKMLYMSFVYDFMDKCLYMDKLHFVEGDTDSMYWGIAGDPNDNIHQGFKNIIKDKEFYDANVYKWFPDPSKGIEDEK
jgi:hypothetical protein